MESGQRAVNDCFFNLFVYEMLIMMVKKHYELPPEKQSQQDLCQEVETIGQQLGMRSVDLLDIKNTTKLTNQQDIMKFIAMSVWPFFFAERINKLQTNNHGFFSLVDEQFRFLSRLSTDRPDSRDFKNCIQVFQAFVVGIIKGALQNLGNDPVPDVKVDMRRLKDTDAFDSLEIKVTFGDKAAKRKK